MLLLQRGGDFVLQGLDDADRVLGIADGAPTTT